MSEKEKLYGSYYGIVYGFLLRLSHDASLSEELAQETVYRAFMNHSQFRGDSKESVWMCSIAKNLYFSWYKTNAKILTVNETMTADDCSSMMENYDDMETAGRIQKLLFEVCEPYQSVFSMHVLAEIPLQEIAQLYGKSDSWARVTYYRAKKMIRERLDKT